MYLEEFDLFQIYMTLYIIICIEKKDHYKNIVLSFGISLLYSFGFFNFIEDEELSILLNLLILVDIVVSLLFFFFIYLTIFYFLCYTIFGVKVSSFSEGDLGLLLKSNGISSIFFLLLLTNISKNDSSYISSKFPPISI